METNQLRKTRSEKLVVLVADLLWGRSCKIGFGLRLNGWHVVLLHRGDLPPTGTSDSFDETHRYANAQEALELARTLQPSVFHVFSHWNFDVAALLIRNRVRVVVLDDYDVLAGVIRDEHVVDQYEKELALERFCLENADGICCRDLLLQATRQATDYKIKGKTIFFPDFCWNTLSLDQRDESIDPSHPNIVYVGNMSIEKNVKTRSPKDNFYFLEFARAMAEAGIHFHIYPSPLPHFMTGFEATLSEHIAFAAETSFYHVHRPLPHYRLLEELQQYDLGLLSLWRGMDEVHPAYKPIMFRNSLSNKIFDYVDAGLGVITCDDIVAQKWLLGRYGVCVSAYLEDVGAKLRDEPPSFWKGLRGRVVDARNKLSVVLHGRRLSAFYESVCAGDNRVLFPIPKREVRGAGHIPDISPTSTELRSTEWGNHLYQVINRTCAERISAITRVRTMTKDQQKDRVLTWEQVRTMKTVRLYAGDIPQNEIYAGWVGLSISGCDQRHVFHDITDPFPLPADSVDAFQAEDVLEHIPYQKLIPVIDEIFRVLKPGGYFRLSVPDYGCDVLRERSTKNTSGQIVFDPGGGGTEQNPGHVWFPRFNSVSTLLKKSAFGKRGTISFLHHWNMDGTFVTKPIDYSKGFVQRTPDFDRRVQSPFRPMSIVVDLAKPMPTSDQAGDRSNSMVPQRQILAGEMTDPVKLSFVVIVLNGMPFLRPCLEAMYSIAHEIIIVEGAVEKCLFAANPDGSSTDGTVEFIRSYPDPGGKLRLIQGKWPEKCEMQNKALESVTGNYVWLVDSDEIYVQKDLLRVKEMLEKDRSITQVNFIPDNFWKGYNHLFVSPLFFHKANHYRRVFKFVTGARFTTHRPPTMVWPGALQSTESVHVVDGIETRRMGIIPFHYSYVLESQVRQKMELYDRYGWGKSWDIDMQKWFHEGFLSWTPGTRETIEKLYSPWAGDSSCRTVRFRGEHPVVMKTLIAESGSAARVELANGTVDLPEQAADRQTSSDCRQVEQEHKRGIMEPQGIVKKRVTVASEVKGDHDLTAVGSESEFAQCLKTVFAEIEPKWILETGTFLGEGTTRVIAETLQSLGLDSSVFCTIECNPVHAQAALQNLAARNLLSRVKLMRGLSVPRAILPTLEEIQERCVRDIEFDDIVVDHHEQERALFYYKETDFAGAQEDLMGEFLRACNYRPDFVLLDSGGHMGNVEFNYLISQLQGPCTIALDDIYHIKHHRSYKQITEDPRFELINVSREKFGFCLARFTPGQGLPDATKHILILRTDSIGDNLLGSTMIPFIKEQMPGVRITVACQISAAPLYETSPYVDEIIPFDRVKALNLDIYREGLLARIQSTGAEVLLNTVYSREPLTDLLALKSGIPLTVAFEGDESNISAEVRSGHNKLYSRIVRNAAGWRSELDRYADFLDAIGIRHDSLVPTLSLDSQDEEAAEQILRNQNLDPDKTVVLFAGAQYGMRLYDGYGKALNTVCRELGFSVLAMGTEHDQEATQRNLKDIGTRTVNLCGKTTLRQTAAVLKRCRLAVGAETGLAHIACAVGAPNVILLGGGHFGRFMPYSPLTSIVCLPMDCYGCNWECRHDRVHCVQDVSSATVEQTIRDRLKKQSPKPAAYIQGVSEKQLDGRTPPWSWFDDYLPLDSIDLNVIGTAPQLPSIEEELARVETLVGQGNRTEAKAILSRWSRRHPVNVDIKNNLAVIDILDRQWQSALGGLQHVLEIDPGNEVAMGNLAVLENVLAGQKKLKEVPRLISARRYAEAKQILSVVLDGDPGDVDALNQLALIEMAENNVTEALGVLQRLLALDPGNETAKEHLQLLVRSLKTKTAPAGEKATNFRPRVSAIVSVYNAERFIKGCLSDLMRQSLYEKGDLEIVIVDSGSNQNEGAIIKEYMESNPNIVHIRTEERETVYAAWNRGIQASSGKYITNSNADDRHCQDGLERLANFLDENPSIDLVYADVKVTETENETFEKHMLSRMCRWLEYQRELLPLMCFIGPQPMWRRSLHDSVGWFDSSYTTSGDWEFWLRAAKNANMAHFPEFLGLYLQSSQSVEHRNAVIRSEEDKKVRELYLPQYLGSCAAVARATEVLDALDRQHPGDAGLKAARSVLAEWTSVRPVSPELIEESFALAEQAVRNEEYPMALRHFGDTQRMLEAGSSSQADVSLYDVYMRSGDTLLKLHDVQGARESFEKALRDVPESAEACFGLGVSFRLAGLTEAASQMFEAAVALKPDWLLARDRYAECLAASSEIESYTIHGQS